MTRTAPEAPRTRPAESSACAATYAYLCARVAEVSNPSAGIIARAVSRGTPLGEPQPWWYGYSIGHWEGDTLVVESNNFRGAEDGPFDGWLDLRGSPYRFSDTISAGQLSIDPGVVLCGGPQGILRVRQTRTRRRTPMN